MSAYVSTDDEARRGLLMILLAAVSWGTVGVATRTLYGISAANPSSVGFFRLGLATPILLLGCLMLFGRKTFHIARRDLVVMALMGGMLAVYQVCFFAALTYVGVAVATLVTLCTAPVMVALLSLVVTRERLSRSVMLALVCALAGTAFLVDMRSGTGEGQIAPLGILLALASAFGYAGMTTAGRTVAGRYHPLQVTTVGFAVGALVLLPLALGTGLPLSYPPQGWGLLLYLGVVPSALAYGLFFTGMRTATATVASIVTLVEPLTATVLARFLFGEQLGALGLVGGLLLLSAIGLLYRGSR